MFFKNHLGNKWGLFQKLLRNGYDYELQLRFSFFVCIVINVIPILVLKCGFGHWFPSNLHRGEEKGLWNWQDVKLTGSVMRSGLLKSSYLILNRTDWGQVHLWRFLFKTTMNDSPPSPPEPSRSCQTLVLICVANEWWGMNGSHGGKHSGSPWWRKTSLPTLAQLQTMSVFGTIYNRMAKNGTGEPKMSTALTQLSQQLDDCSECISIFQLTHREMHVRHPMTEQYCWGICIHTHKGEEINT